MSTPSSKPLALRVRLPYENEASFVERYGANLDRSGIFIATRSVKPEGTLVHFEFILASGLTVLRGQGRVTQSQPETEGGRAGMTVGFDSLDAASTELVERVVARRTPVPTPPGMRPRSVVSGAKGVGSTPLPVTPPPVEREERQIPLFEDEREVQSGPALFERSTAEEGAQEPSGGEENQLPLSLEQNPPEIARPERPHGDELANAVHAAGAASASKGDEDRAQEYGASAVDSERTDRSGGAAEQRTEENPQEYVGGLADLDRTDGIGSAAEQRTEEPPHGDQLENAAHLAAAAEPTSSEGTLAEEPPVRTRADDDSLLRSSAAEGTREKDQENSPAQVDPLSESTAGEEDAGTAPALEGTQLVTSPASDAGTSTVFEETQPVTAPPSGVAADATENALPAPSRAPANFIVGIDVGSSATRVALLRQGELQVLPIRLSRRRDLKAIDEQNTAATEALRNHLRALRTRCSELLGADAQRAVLAVPSSFSLLQREQWRAASIAAGWDVVRLVDEPAAAAIAFGRGRQLPRRRLLVIDLGAGMLDVAVVQVTGDEFEVVTAGGDPQLGGDQIDAALLGLARSKLPEGTDSAFASQEIEQAKITLSRDDTAELSAGDTRVAITRAEFEQLLTPVLDRIVVTIECVLSSTGLNAQSVDEVLLVGAQGRTPRIVERLAAALGKPVRSDEGMGLNLEGAVAMGAALVGDGLIQAERAAPGTKFSGALTSPISLGLRGGGLKRILDRGTRLPTVKTLSFPIIAATPTALAFFQGDSLQAESSIFLGATTLSSERDGELHVHFHLSPDGMATVDATLPGGKSMALPLDRTDPPVASAAQWPELRQPTPERRGFWSRLLGRK